LKITKPLFTYIRITWIKYDLDDRKVGTILVWQFCYQWPGMLLPDRKKKNEYKLQGVLEEPNRMKATCIIWAIDLCMRM